MNLTPVGARNLPVFGPAKAFSVTHLCCHYLSVYITVISVARFTSRERHLFNPVVDMPTAIALMRFVR